MRKGEVDMRTRGVVEVDARAVEKLSRWWLVANADSAESRGRTNSCSSLPWQTIQAAGSSARQSPLSLAKVRDNNYHVCM
jgi:hypothetical protein